MGIWFVQGVQVTLLAVLVVLVVIPSIEVLVELGLLELLAILGVPMMVVLNPREVKYPLPHASATIRTLAPEMPLLSPSPRYVVKNVVP
jgi:hypothetical protein